MEIKVGDKVRVSKDAPEMYFFGCNYDNSVCKVILVDRDDAVITQVKNGSFAIPTKYLIKVDAEAKEAKFKEGDKVVVHYSTGDRIGRIQEVLYDGYYDIDYGGGRTGHHIIESRLVPYTEPTEPVQPKEQTEAEKNYTDNIVDDFAKVMEGYRKVFADIADNFDWLRYEADLAKEIAVKITNKKMDNDPKDAAEYAVSVAKAVVENLKKK